MDKKLKNTPIFNDIVSFNADAPKAKSDLGWTAMRDFIAMCVLQEESA